MKRVLAFCLQLGCALAFTGPGTLASEQPADAVIELSGPDLERLGIRFDTVRPSNGDDGFRVPALVIHSPNTRSRLTSYFPGTLKKWHSQAGTTVRAGDPVVTLLSPGLMQHQEQWLDAHHQLRGLVNELERDRQLFDEGIIAEQRLLRTQRRHRQAVFRLQALRRQLQQAGLGKEDFTALAGGTLSAGEYVLRAPGNGLLSRADYGVGDIIDAGETLATVTDRDTLWLRAELPAALAAQLQPGQPLQVSPGGSRVTVMSRNRDLSPTTQSIGLLARFEQATDFAAGQQVSLVISRGDGLLIPGRAVTHTGGRTYVYLKHERGVEARPLTLQPLGSDYLATTGIEPGDRLAVQGTAQLKGMQLGLGGGE